MTVEVDTTDEIALTGFVLSLGARDWVRFVAADGHHSFAVPMSPSSSQYCAASASNCTCDEHQLNGGRCTHIWAVRFHMLREQGEDFAFASSESPFDSEALHRSECLISHADQRSSR
jgi:hypothetical protein